MAESQTGLFSVVKMSVVERSWRGTAEGVLACLVFFPVLLSYLPLGFSLSLMNFTYGVGALDPATKARIPQFLAATVAMTYGVEILFRGVLLRSLLRRWSWEKAFWIHLAIVNVLLLPFFLKFGGRIGEIGVFRFFLQENLLQTLWALFFLRTGSLIATAWVHGF